MPPSKNPPPKNDERESLSLRSTKPNTTADKASSLSAVKRDGNETSENVLLQFLAGQITDQVMALLTSDFTPAQYHDGKCAYVDFYIKHPGTGVAQRVRKKFNRIKDPATRRETAEHYCKKINLKLMTGWNPLAELAAKNSSQNLRSAINYYIEQLMPSKEDSVRTYLSRINIFLEWCNSRGYADEPAYAFDHEKAIRFLGEIAKSRNLGPRSYNNNMTVLRSVFNKLIEHHFVIKNPFAGISKKKTTGKNREAIPLHVLEAIHLDITKNDPKFMLAMKMLYYCGIRPSELCRLQVHNIRFQESVIYINADQSKNGKDATVTVPTDLMNELAQHCGECSMNTYIFGKNKSNLQPGKEMLNARRLSKHWTAMRERTGIPMIYKFYSLKDTGATWLAGIISPNDLKNQFRHHNLGITEIYIQRAKPTANRTIVEIKGAL